MINQILADYYEHNLLIKKAQRLRRKNFKVVYGWHVQYNHYLNGKYSYYSYGYDKGNAWWFNYGSGNGYIIGNGVLYK